MIVLYYSFFFCIAIKNVENKFTLFVKQKHMCYHCATNPSIHHRHHRHRYIITMLSSSSSCCGHVVATVTLWWCLCHHGVAFTVASSWFHHCDGIAVSPLLLVVVSSLPSWCHHCSCVIVVPLLSHHHSFIIVTVLPLLSHCRSVIVMVSSSLL